MKKRILALVLLLCMAASCACAERFIPTVEMPSKGPSIVSQPADVTVKANGSCKISVEVKKAKTYTWRLYDPETGETVLCTDAPDRFTGLKVSGKNGKTLTLSGVPESLNGWMAFCVIKNGSQNVVSQYALITVTDPSGQPLAEGRQFLLDPTEIHTITVTGKNVDLRAVDYKGRPIGNTSTEMTFEEEADLAVIAKQKTTIWYINGVRYVFPAKVGTIIIRKLTWDLNIEAGQAAEETKPGEGDGLIVHTISARLKLSDEQSGPSGSWMDTFDFSAPYTAANGAEHPGGSVTVQVQATIPAGKYISLWKFNEARFDFDVRVTGFRVDDLNTAFVYEPLFGSPKQPEPQPDEPTPYIPPKNNSYIWTRDDEPFVVN